MTDWLDELTPDERDGWDRFVEHTRRETLGMMSESAFIASLVPKKDEVDVKFAVELGLAIMLDKPIIAIAMPGAEIPSRLRRVADRVVEADIDTEEGRREAGLALREFIEDDQV